MENKNVPWSNEEVQMFLFVVADQGIQRELDGATRNQKIFQELSERMAACGYNRSLKQCREKFEKLKSDCPSIKDHNGQSGSNRRCWKWLDEMDAIYGHQPANNGRESSLDSAAALLETFENESLSTCGAPAASLALAAASPAPAAASPSLAAARLAPPRTPTPSTSTSSTQQRPVAGKRKRSHSSDLASVLAQMRSADQRHQAQDIEQRDKHIQLLLNDAREAREQEAALRAREAAQEEALRRAEMAQTAAFNQAFLGVLERLVDRMGSGRV